jgi:uncharacterized membrane protein
MNILVPRPWDSVSYAAVCIIALAMAVFTLGFLWSHCEWVEEQTGIAGACGLGYGWIIITLIFIAIAVYAGRELVWTLKEREEK